jgi:hypothetical protein
MIRIILSAVGWTGGIYQACAGRIHQHRSREYAQALPRHRAPHASHVRAHSTNISHVALAAFMRSFIKAEVILSFLGSAR